MQATFDTFKPNSLDEWYSLKRVSDRCLDLPNNSASSLGNTESNSHSLSVEINLASLSSDSGIQTKMSEGCGSGEIFKTADDVNKEQIDSNDEKPIDRNLSAVRQESSGLARSNSVKARASMFQALEERSKRVEEPKLKPKVTRCKSFISAFFFIYYVMQLFCVFFFFNL